MVFLAAKRSREEGELATMTSMANYLIYLSGGGRGGPELIAEDHHRVFECKTCNRQFPSFQALGGHRASHKKPKSSPVGDSNNNQVSSEGSPPLPKQKTHECSVCGLEFALGQALGGHMRRHRPALMNNDHHQNDIQLLSLKTSDEVVKVVKKPDSPRILCLDLNLTPWENDLEFLRVGKFSPKRVLTWMDPADVRKQL